MHKTIRLFLVVAGALVALIGFSTLIISWFQDYSSYADPYDLPGNVFKIGGLVVYAYFGVRFFDRHVDSLR